MFEMNGCGLIVIGVENDIQGVKIPKSSYPDLPLYNYVSRSTPASYVEKMRLMP